MKQFRDCPAIERLCEYARGLLSREERGVIERHLASCDHCLDTFVSICDGMKFSASKKYKKRPRFKKTDLLLLVAIVSFLLSFIFKHYFLQFLVATLIFSIKWIADTKSNRTLIIKGDVSPSRNPLPRKELRT